MKENIRWAAFQPLIGGMMIGAENALGCKPTCVIDYDGVENSNLYVDYQKNVLKTDLKHFIIDGNLLSFSDKLKEGFSWDDEELKNLDIVVGVPLCSGLSSANVVIDNESKNKRGSDAQQNNNMLGMIDITLSKLKPKVYIFENAYFLATPLGKDLKEKLIEISNKYGYSTGIVKVNTINHGLPQNRKRTFFMCYKEDEAPLMTYNPVEVPTIAEILEGLTNQEPYQTNEEDAGWIAYLKEKFGDNFREAWVGHLTSAEHFCYELGDLEYAKKFFNENGVKKIDKIFKKVNDGKGWMTNSLLWCGFKKLPSLFGRTMGRVLHPIEDRTLSIRENMRLMGLPDNFPEVEKKKIFMIGQNVPVCTATYYMDQIKKYLNGELKSSGKNHVEQDFMKGFQENSKKSIKTGFSKLFKN